MLIKCNEFSFIEAPANGIIFDIKARAFHSIPAPFAKAFQLLASGIISLVNILTVFPPKLLTFQQKLE